ncbi:GTPase [Arthrobacter agilis]|uniref:GTPase n=1 Tax=Arthrobacter agilis TaxID=37921 RepID=UPI002782DD69|nr:GTPase [Arthrobacter agilis]MDQ0735265.1 GTP-binding protein EngB required for normal cell division [Arthrobacter agilis]
MSRHRGATAEAPLAETLTGVLEDLQAAYWLGTDRLPEEHLARLHATLDRAGSRRSLSADHTVVGVFGPTGSGKSSLVNALSGTDVARVAARRPTTSEPLALVWGRQGSDELLDWLGVRVRVELPDGAPLAGSPGTAQDPRAGADAPPPAAQAAGEEPRTPDDAPSGAAVAAPAGSTAPGIRADAPGEGRRGLLRWRRRGRAASPVAPEAPATASPARASGPAAGLILLDLPDFDSTALVHREIVERLSGQVDVLLWVVDPQKYADAALHHGFLRGLAHHDAVTLVALNQADRLQAQDLEEVTASLRGILAGEGLQDVAVVPVSALTRQGVGDLARVIGDLVGSRAAAGRRIAADAARAADDLLPFAAEEPVAGPSEEVRAVLAEELASAAGVPVVVDAVRSSYRRDAHAAMGWPVTRWLGAFRPDPLRRLNLRRQDVVPEVRRSSLPLSRPAQRARADQALRVFGDEVARGVVEPWRTSIRDAARGTADDLTDALDSAVTAADLETGRRAWWAVFGVLQWVAFAALVAGLAWLGVLAVLGFLQLPAVDVPRVEGFPVPTLLIAGGAGAGILLGVLAALLARWGAARRAARVRRRLFAACARAAEGTVVAPVEAEVDRCNRFRDAVSRARRA